MTEAIQLKYAAPLDRLLETLRAIPELRIDSARPEREASTSDRICDASIGLRVGERSITLLVEIKKAVYPRDVRQVLWQLRDCARKATSNSDHETQPILVAESISPGAKELLRAQRVGYFDSGGSLFLPARGVYLYIDKPPPKSLERSTRTLFSGRRAQVLHALLVRHRAWFGVTEIAEEAQVAPSTASEVLSQLDRFDWLESRGQGPGKERHLRQPGALLDEWVNQQTVVRPPPMRRYYLPGLKTDVLSAAAVAKFELGETEEPELREARILRQREAADVIERLLALMESTGLPLAEALPETSRYPAGP
jgi:hypothetical protein